MSIDDSTTARQREWGATMRGHHIDGVEVAHADSSAAIDLLQVVDRKIRERSELPLSDGATLADGAGNRVDAEEPDQLRTCFERDRDRIVHATAFRRLAGKTQVVVDPGDHQRTRLTHALEVAQVARSVADALGLNVALAEAIALGHDCGHGPGGHASEDAFEPYLPGGFDHAVWGADVTLTPLNLCAETLDGIRNHSWSRPAPSTPEGEVVSWADRIAYVCHDFEDAVAAGMVSPESLPAIVVDRCGLTRRLQLAAFIHAMVSATEATGRIGMAPREAEALAAFREFNYRNIYLRPQSRQQAEKVISVLRGLVDYLIENPNQLPDRLTDPVQHETHAPASAAVAWVAGMTDQYAFRSAQQWLGWDPAALPLS